MRSLGKYLEVAEPQPSKSGKTQIWDILGVRSGLLGQVGWFGRWRCYAFYPEPNTVFNAECMAMLANFCETETKIQRSKKL